MRGGYGKRGEGGPVVAPSSPPSHSLIPHKLGCGLAKLRSVLCDDLWDAHGEIGVASLAEYSRLWIVNRKVLNYNSSSRVSNCKEYTVK